MMTSEWKPPSVVSEVRMRAPRYGQIPVEFIVRKGDASISDGKSFDVTEFVVGNEIIQSFFDREIARNTKIFGNLYRMKADERVLASSGFDPDKMEEFVDGQWLSVRLPTMEEALTEVVGKEQAEETLARWDRLGARPVI